MFVRLKRIANLRNSGRGQSLVELAVVLPLIMTLVMGVVDFGWILYAHVQVASAAGAAARAGALHAGDLDASDADNQTARTAAIRTAVYDSSTTPVRTFLGLLKADSVGNFAVNSDVIVSHPGTALNNARKGQDVVVTVRYRQSVWFQVIPGASGGFFQVSSTARQRIQ